jgi:uncharacterized membrane protein
VVGISYINNTYYATEWSGGSSINLGALPGAALSVALGINDTGQVVGFSGIPAPEPSTWAMMLFGFAGLAFAGYRRAKAGHATSLSGSAADRDITYRIVG